MFAIDHVSPLFRDGIESLGWTRTDGVILHAGRGWKRVITDDGESHDAWLRLRYAYEVPSGMGGMRPLTGGRYDVSTSTTGGKHEYSMTTIGMARTCLADAPSIPVFYDPEDPERSLVSPGIPYSTGGWVILITSLFVVALWLLRAAREKGKYDTRSLADRARPPPPQEAAPLGGHYVKDEHGEYWRDEPESGEEVPEEFAEDEPPPAGVVDTEPEAPASKREASVLGAVLMGVFVPLGGFALMAGGAYLWEKAIGGVPPAEIVLGYCAFTLLVAVAPKLAETKVGRTGLAVCVLGIPLLGAVALAFVFYEDMTDSEVRRISYEPEEAWLVDQMRSSHPDVREVAVRRAGSSTGFEAVKPLIVELCEDPHPDVRDAARHAAYRRHLRWR